MPSSKDRLYGLLSEDTLQGRKTSQLVRDQCRLRKLRQVQLLVGILETKSSHVVADDIAGTIKNLASTLELTNEVRTHSTVLCTLPWKHKKQLTLDVGHFTLLQNKFVITQSWPTPFFR